MPLARRIVLVLRRIAWYSVAPLVWLGNISGYIGERVRYENLLADLRDERLGRNLAEDLNVRLKADLEHSLAWRDAEIARKHAEADAERAKSAAATTQPDRE